MNGITLLLPCCGSSDLIQAQAVAIDRCFDSGAWRLQLIAPATARRGASQTLAEAFRNRPGAEIEVSGPMRAATSPGFLAAALPRARHGVVAYLPAGGADVARLSLLLVDRLSRFDAMFAKRRRPFLDKQRRRLLRLASLAWTPGLRDPDLQFWAARRESIELAIESGAAWRRLPWTLHAAGCRVGELRLPRYEFETWSASLRAAEGPRVLSLPSESNVAEPRKRSA